MEYVNNVRDRMRRIMAVKRIKKQFSRLDIPVQKFCLKNGLDNTQISHAIAGRRGLEWETIKKIDKALTALGLGLDVKYPKEKTCQNG